MIWSVSTFVRFSGTAVPVCVVKASSQTVAASLQVGGCGQTAGQRGGGGHGRADQVGAATLALPALEVAVAGGRRPLARLELVGVHAQAHRAPGAAPLGPGVEEDPVEALGLGLRLDRHRPGDDEHPGVGVDVPAAQQLGGDPEVLDPAVGARPEEDGVDLDLRQRGAGGQAHVGQRLLRGLAVALVGERRRVRHRGTDRQTLARVGAPGDVGRQRGGVEVYLAVEDGAVVGAQRRPVLDGGVPVGALRVRAGGPGGSRTSSASGAISPALAPASIDMLQIVIRASIDSASMALPRYSMTCPCPPPVPISAMTARMMSFAETPGCELAVDRDRHLLRGVLGQRLGGQHVLHLARPDAEGQRTERPVRGGVAVAADDRHAGLGQAELRADDVHDALVAVAHGCQPDAELGGVAAQRLHLGPADRVGDRGEDVQRRDVVVLGGHREVGTADRAPGGAEPVEGLRAGHLVHEVQVDVEQIGLPRGAAHHMGLVDLLRQRLRHGRSPH